MSEKTYTVSELAQIVGGTLRGNGSATICGVADLREATPQQAAWVSRESFHEAVALSRAGVVLVPANFGPTPMPAVLCPKIDDAVAKLLGAFAIPDSRPAVGVHPTAVVDPTASLGADCAIGPNVVIEKEVVIGATTVIHAGVYIGFGSTIGDECEIWPNAVIRHQCILGRRVRVHSCAVIGKEGFGFYYNGEKHVRVPHIGGVILEDDVEIGACSCVDRAKFGHTVVGRGTKIDNQVQVAHNCRLGAYNVLAGQTGLSGSVRTGDFCIMGARVASFDNLTIGHGVQLGGISVVTKDLPDGMKASGFPAQDLKKELREKAALRRLPALDEKIKELIHRVERLEASAHHTA